MNKQFSADAPHIQCSRRNNVKLMTTCSLCTGFGRAELSLKFNSGSTIKNAKATATPLHPSVTSGKSKLTHLTLLVPPFSSIITRPNR